MNASVGYITAGYEMGERFTPQPNVLRTVDGGRTWQRLDFRAALHDAPYGGYLGCCIFMQGTTTEIRCFTPLNGITLENVSLVSEDFGETWNWYPRMYVRDEAGTITAIRYFTACACSWRNAKSSYPRSRMRPARRSMPPGASGWRKPSHARRQSVPDGGTQKGRGVPRPFAISFLKIAPALFSDFPQWFPGRPFQSPPAHSAPDAPP